MIEKGQKIDDRYEIIRSIGEGGMANVYLAYDPCLNRKVAVKILRGDLAADEKFVRRFQREAVSASSLTHPNIVEVYDVGEDHGKYFIVMEYVEGKTLKQLIKRRGSITLPEVVDIMLQLTSAIAKAHESYIIHRDIKPQNVIILEDGRVKVMDFGIAAQLGSNELTQTNSVMGTVYYLPPEQASGSVADVKSDIYSMGILMFELIAGRVPFKGDSPVEVAIKHIKTPIPDLTKIIPDLPNSVFNVILKACAKNPMNRYDSAIEMHNDLKTVLDEDRFDEPLVKYEYPETDFADTDDEDDTRENRSKKKSKKNKEKKLDKKIKIMGLIAAILLFAVLFVFFIYPSFIADTTAKVPNVSDMTVSQAKDMLKEKGFKVDSKTKKKYNDEIDKGKVIKTTPKSGSKVSKKEKITLIVSKGTKKIEIEDYTGEDYKEIQESLEASGITVNIQNKEVQASTGYKTGTIIEQSVKKGEKLGKGDEITLVVATLYEVYPDFTKGYSVDDVTSWAKEKNITLEVKTVTDDSKNNGTIVGQNMAAGSKISTNSALVINVVQNAEKKNNETPTTDNAGAGVDPEAE